MAASVARFYNTTDYAGTGFSLFFLTFGRTPRLGLELAPMLRVPREQQEFVTEMRAVMKEAHERARLLAHAAAVARNERRDRGQHYAHYDVGQFVMMRIKVRAEATGLAPKLQYQWRAPLRVVRQVTPVTYALERGGEDTSYMHEDYLRFHQEWSDFQTAHRW